MKIPVLKAKNSYTFIPVNRINKFTISEKENIWNVWIETTGKDQFAYILESFSKLENAEQYLESVWEVVSKDFKDGIKANFKKNNPWLAAQSSAIDEIIRTQSMEGIDLNELKGVICK